eukprot:NODE_887_length_1134_cov_82.474677_g845_i0.p1 GENE.NODE_887_length_1134_cov_82.474677_g845_i0~~NODE_887_length_1134_cov_82.474677_g845_i0.p1  ORF type:complete len:303 (-),score=36.26 NODE_887_length_1134_cov_82.474677_g845_i0:112-1020(-)
MKIFFGVLVAAFLASVQAATLSYLDVPACDGGFYSAGSFSTGPQTVAMADDFTLTETTTFDGIILFVSSYSTDATGATIGVRFYSDLPSGPGAEDATRTAVLRDKNTDFTQTEFQISNAELQYYHADLSSPVTLPAGTFWVGLRFGAFDTDYDATGSSVQLAYSFGGNSKKSGTVNPVNWQALNNNIFLGFYQGSGTVSSGEICGIAPTTVAPTTVAASGCATSWTYTINGSVFVSGGSSKTLVSKMTQPTEKTIVTTSEASFDAVEDQGSNTYCAYTYSSMNLAGCGSAQASVEVVEMCDR